MKVVLTTTPINKSFVWKFSILKTNFNTLMCRRDRFGWFLEVRVGVDKMFSAYRLTGITFPKQAYIYM